MCDKETAESLIEKLDKFNVEQAPSIVDQIITCGEIAIEPLFVAFFTGKQTTEKEYILQALSALIDKTELIHVLLKYVDRLTNFGRYYSIKYLFEVGDASMHEKLIPHMIADLGGNFFCKTFAREALPKCAEMAIDQIISALMEQCNYQDEYFDDRFADLISILGRIDDDRGITPLIAALYSTRNKEMFQSLIWTFESLGRRVVPALLQVIRDEGASLAIKKCAVHSLDRIPDKRSVNDLILLLDHQDHDLRQSVVAALGAVQDNRATPHLIRIIQTDPHDHVRAEAAIALGPMRDKQAIQVLIHMMKTDPYPDARCRAAFSLRYHRGIEVVTALVEALHDDEEIVPIWARHALDAMGSDARPLLRKLHEQQPEVIDRAYNTWSWEFVSSCRQDEELQANAVVESSNAREFYADRAHDCPICGKPAAELVWSFISTPAETWRNLVGRAGWITICDDCHIQVDFFLEAMN